MRIWKVIDLRLRFLVEYPGAFAPDNIKQRVGHLTAVNIAKQELCKVTGKSQRRKYRKRSETDEKQLHDLMTKSEALDKHNEVDQLVEGPRFGLLGHHDVSADSSQARPLTWRKQLALRLRLGTAHTNAYAIGIHASRTGAEKSYQISH